jgi:general secretion pathway protein L
MRARLFIRIASLDSQPAEWLRVDAGGTSTGPFTGALSEVAAQAAGSEVIVLVPGDLILLTGAQVPSRNRQRIAEAIPFALEEQLIEDVDNLHFALGQRDEDGLMHTAVVDRARMDEWLTRLNDAGVRPDALVPDILAVPWTAGEWSLMIEADVALLRTGPQTGYAMDTRNLEAILPAALSGGDRGQPPQRLRVIPCGADLSPVTVDLSIPVESEPPPPSALLLLARGYDPHFAINLLQGHYSRREQLGKLWRPWRPAAALLLVWLLIQAGVTVGEYLHLKRQTQALSDDIEQTFRAALPETKHIVNARVQMQRAIDALRGGGDATQGGFMSLLAQIGPQLVSDTGMQLERLNYNDGQLDLAIFIGDLQRLDALKQRLSKNTDFSVNIQSATAKADGVEARLQIKGKAS